MRHIRTVRPGVTIVVGDVDASSVQEGIGDANAYVYFFVANFSHVLFTCVIW